MAKKKKNKLKFKLKFKVVLQMQLLVLHRRQELLLFWGPYKLCLPNCYFIIVADAKPHRMTIHLQKSTKVSNKKFTNLSKIFRADCEIIMVSIQRFSRSEALTECSNCVKKKFEGSVSQEVLKANTSFIIFVRIICKR